MLTTAFCLVCERKRTAPLSTPYLRDHEFEYWNTYPSRDEVHKKGTWQTGADMCWVGDGGVKGNLMIHLGTERCCHRAYFLGKNLVLNSLAKPRYGGVCDDRVLIKDSDKK